MSVLYPKASIIVPCKNINEYLKQCIKKCSELDYTDIEVIILPDVYDDKAFGNKENMKVIPTGNVSPGKKRNSGFINSSGKIIAYIDDDAYPHKDWLKNALKYLESDEVAAVGGPGITPPEDSDMQKVSGYILSSILVGNLRNRYKPKELRETDDVHSCNFIIKREIMEKLMWNEEYWPGEDTLICRDIRKMGYKIIEASDVMVYHHRKPIFIPHLKQIFQFGLHRGFFFKRFPENSRKLVYLLPSLLVSTILAGVISAITISYMGIAQIFMNIVLIILLIYLILTMIASLKQTRSLKLLPLTWIGIIFTHVTYGIGFIIGLLKKDIRKWIIKE